MSESYSGGMFDDSVTAGRVSGEIRFDAGTLIFETDEGKVVELPLHGLEISEGGTAHRMIFFSHPNHPQVSLYSTDRRILKSPEIASTYHSAEQAGRARRRIMGRRALLLMSLLLIVGLLGGAWILKNVMVSVVVKNIPAEWEQTLGKAALMGFQNRFVKDEEAQQLLQELVKPLLDTVGEGGPAEFEFHIVKDDAINAFAAPGGFVVINTGLLEAAERPEQVLGVLAHEIAHVTRRHGLRAMVDSLSIRILLAFLTGGTELPKELVDGSSRLLQLKHSRKQEQEADEVGWDHLVRAGIDPSGLEEFFELIHQEHHHAEALELLSTHPAPQSRIEDLRRRREQLDDTVRLNAVDPKILYRLQEELGLQVGSRQ